MTDDRAAIQIASSHLSVAVDPLGAQMLSLCDAAGRDLQWSGDPAVWAGRAPILFPIVGELRGGHYRLDGAAYALRRHGFARHSLFEVAAATPASAVFRLRADASTRSVYPFAFELEITFALTGPVLTLTAELHNPGAAALPASFGFHPAFAWPLPYGQPRHRHALWFDQDEPEAIRRLDANGLLTPEGHPTPVAGRRLALEDKLFEADAVIFDALRSRGLRYGAPEGPHLRIAFPDAAYLGVWTKPGGRFICVEPWWGLADPVGFAGEFRQKPGVFEVAPGDTRRMAMSITWRAEGLEPS